MLILLKLTLLIAGIYCCSLKSAVYAFQVTKDRPITTNNRCRINDPFYHLNFHLYAKKEKDQLKDRLSSISNTPLTEYFATCIPGLALTLEQELTQLGAKNVQISGNSGVSFTNDSTSKEDIGMKALLWLRTAHRIMEKVASTSDVVYEEDGINLWQIQDRDSLYEYIQYAVTPYVQRLLGNGEGGLLTLSVSTVLNGSLPKELCHSHYTSLTVKNAIVDLVRDMRQDGIRPDVDTSDPDVPFVLVLKGMRNQRNALDISVEATLYRMLHSSGSLHKRGYRVETVHKASMKESLAAGLLLEAGYDKLILAAREDGLPAVLIDPMCGSGTFCLEAALIAADFAPGLVRIKLYQSNDEDNTGIKQRMNPHLNPPVLRWKDSNKEYWKQLLLDAKDRASSGTKWMRCENSNPDRFGGTFPHHIRKNVVILGNELNHGALLLADGNIEKAGFKNDISLTQGDCIDWRVSDAVVPGRTIIVSNPPWGLRLTEDVEQSWISLKRFLRQECHNCEAWILSGNKDATKHLRMKRSRSVVIKTADEDLRWIQYHIFQDKDEMSTIAS